MDISLDLLKHLPKWCDNVPFQVKKMAIAEASKAFWEAKGRPAFRKLKNPEQSCYIPKSAIKKSGIYPRISGKELIYFEALPDNAMDSRLIWRFNRWWLAVPSKRSIEIAENQGRVVALDPGIRKFITFFSTESCGFIGEGDFSRIQRLCSWLDKLFSKRATVGSKKEKRSITKAIRRMQFRIKSLIDELHHKTAKFLTDNFDVILLPTFETKQMVSKANRKIRSKSVRNMLTFSHFRFKQFITWKARCTGKIVVDVNEAYTSKTHPQTGEIKNIGSSKTIRLLDGSLADRDICGARGIMLRALVDLPMLLTCSYA